MAQTENRRAIKTYRKAGFKDEGYQHQAIYKQGAYRDVTLMAILRKDYFDLCKRNPS